MADQSIVVLCYCFSKLISAVLCCYAFDLNHYCDDGDFLKSRRVTGLGQLLAESQQCLLGVRLKVSRLEYWPLI